MYLNNLIVRFNLRLTQEQFDFLCDMSNAFNISPSEVVRMFIDSYRGVKGGLDSHEDEQAVFHNQL